MITRIITINIGNIKSKKIQPQLEELFKLNADIYCLQNIKSNNHKDVAKRLNKYLNNTYEIIGNYNDKINNEAGVVTLVKKQLFNDNYVSIDTPKFSDVAISDEIDGHFLCIEFKKYLLFNILTYDSNTIDSKNQFEKLLIVYIKILQNKLNKRVLICGDFNTIANKFDSSLPYNDIINSQLFFKEYKINHLNNLMNICELEDIIRYHHGKSQIFTYLIWLFERSVLYL